jgi:hypothetical protein
MGTNARRISTPERRELEGDELGQEQGSVDETLRFAQDDSPELKTQGRTWPRSLGSKNWKIGSRWGGKLRRLLFFREGTRDRDSRWNLDRVAMGCGGVPRTNSCPLGGNRRRCRTWRRAFALEKYDLVERAR